MSTVIAYVLHMLYNCCCEFYSMFGQYLDSSRCAISLLLLLLTLYRNSLYRCWLSKSYCFNKHSTLCDQSKLLLVFTGAGLYMELFAQKVCILRVRDCPFPLRINNKIIITKSTERLKGWFLQYSPFIRTTWEDISYRGKGLYWKIIRGKKQINERISYIDHTTI